MKNLFFAAIAMLAFATQSYAQEQYLVITSFESIVPGGLGRSRILMPKEAQDAAALSRDNTADGKSKEKASRKDVKIDDYEETMLLNFYSMVGINMKNIASNDAVITSKINQLASEGWTLAFVTSGVESDAGKQDGNGIFITRYIFKK